MTAYAVRKTAKTKVNELLGTNKTPCDVNNADYVEVSECEETKSLTKCLAVNRDEKRWELVEQTKIKEGSVEEVQKRVAVHYHSLSDSPQPLFLNSPSCDSDKYGSNDSPDDTRHTIRNADGICSRRRRG